MTRLAMTRLVLVTLFAGVLVLAPATMSASADDCAAPHTAHMTFNPCAALDNGRMIDATFNGQGWLP